MGREKLATVPYGDMLELKHTSGLETFLSGIKESADITGHLKGD